MKRNTLIASLFVLGLMVPFQPGASADEAPAPYGTISISVNPDFSSCAVATFSGTMTQPNIVFEGAGQIGGVPYADATSTGPGSGQSVTGCLGSRSGLIETATVHYEATAVGIDDATSLPVTIVANKDCVWLGDNFSCTATVSESAPPRICIC